MPFSISALATVNLAVGTQNFMFAGLLAELARDLDVSIGTAGLLVPASSITFALLAPFATAWASKYERRAVIVLGLVSLAVCNTMCAIVPSFVGLFALRVLGGAITAIAGSIASVAVTALVPPERRGRAFAIVVGGLTVALVLGVPIGSVVGGHFGWRATFAYSAGVCALSAPLILFGVPRIEPTSGSRAEIAPLLRNRDVVRAFALAVLGFAAAFTIVAYLGPIINRLTGLSGAAVGPLQAFIGIGSFIGLAAGGMAADRKTIRVGLTVAFVLMAVDIAAYSWALSRPISDLALPTTAAMILLLAFAMFAAVPMNLAQLTQLAGPATPVALAFNGSLVSLGQGLGAIYGGVINDHAGLAWLGAGGTVIALGGVLLSTRTSGTPNARALS